jgi:hypothetical protein
LWCYTRISGLCCDEKIQAWITRRFNMWTFTSDIISSKRIWFSMPVSIWTYSPQLRSPTRYLSQWAFGQFYMFKAPPFISMVKFLILIILRLLMFLPSLLYVYTHPGIAELLGGEIIVTPSDKYNYTNCIWTSILLLFQLIHKLIAGHNRV